MPKTFKQNKEIKEKRRENILDTSLNLFIRNGYENVSIDSISNALKCSHSLLYHYFISKEEIYKALDDTSWSLLNEIFLSLDEADPGFKLIQKLTDEIFNLIYKEDKNAKLIALFFEDKLNKVNGGLSIKDSLLKKKIFTLIFKSFSIIKKDIDKNDKFSINEIVILYFSFIKDSALNKIHYPNLFKSKPDINYFFLLINKEDANV